MKITRTIILSMLILTLTLVVASCDTATLTETSVARGGTYQFDNLEDRIENTRRAETDRGREPAASATEGSTAESSEPKGKRAPFDNVALTAEAAEDIALAHAGIARADVLYLHTEADRDDGIPEYEVEFGVALPDGTGYTEYEYTVHADTGVILELETEQEFRR